MNMLPRFEMVAEFDIGPVPPGSVIPHPDTDARRPVAGVAVADVADGESALS
jgi:hypothetical protein